MFLHSDKLDTNLDALLIVLTFKLSGQKFLGATSSKCVVELVFVPTILVKTNVSNKMVNCRADWAVLVEYSVIKKVMGVAHKKIRKSNSTKGKRRNQPKIM